MTDRARQGSAASARALGLQQPPQQQQAQQAQQHDQTDKTNSHNHNNNQQQQPTDSPRPSSSSSSSQPPSLPTRPLSVRLSSTTRPSFHDSLRTPASPRARRQPSFPQAAVHTLLAAPPPRARRPDPRFAGRDWTQISIGELARPTDLHFVDAGASVEDATAALVRNTDTRCLLIREGEGGRVCGTFDFADLNAYLLLVVGLVQPGGREEEAAFAEVARKAKEGRAVALRDVKAVAPSKEPLVMLPRTANLRKAVETFGGGVHRVVVTEEGGEGVVGIFTQLRLVKFLWTNGESFPVIDRLYPQTLCELKVCSQQVQWISGESPLYKALQILHNEGLSSVAVVDNQMNVLGNISIVDVKLLTKSSSLPLLNNTCAHFISIILSTRGLVDGQDSYPVFHVNPNATLAHTIAKLAATKSHRMWVTDPQSPAKGSAQTQGGYCQHAGLPSSLGEGEAGSRRHSVVELAREQEDSLPPSSASTPPPSSPTSASNPPTPGAATNASPATAATTPYLPAVPQSALERDLPPPAAPPSLSTASSTVSLPTVAAAAASTTTHAHAHPPAPPSSVGVGVPTGCARLSGRLVGLVSLTDVLNLYARASGLSPRDPNISRHRRRRGSSSSSMGVRVGEGSGSERGGERGGERGR